MNPRTRTLFATLFCLAILALGHAGAPKQTAAPPGASIGDFSGTYSFLREGEDLQINVRNGKLDGFVTRYGESETDRNVQLQHFFEKSSVNRDEVSFTTDKIHGVWFEFKGKVRRGEAKTAADEGYYVLEGTITRFETGADKKATGKSREVQFRSLPSDFGVTFPDQKKNPDKK